MKLALRVLLTASVVAACGGARPVSSALPAAGVATGDPLGGDPVEGSPEGSCGGLADPPRVVTSMLGDRVHIALPEEAGVRGAPRSLMEAEPSRAVRELAWIAHGDARMALLARELFTRETGAPIEAIRAIAPGGWALEASDALVIASPPALEQTGTDVGLGLAWWRDADGHVVQMQMVTDAETARRGGCIAFARELLRGVTGGTRRLALEARTVSLGNWRIDVPAGWADYTDVGDDFDVYRFVHVAPFGGPYASAGIYVGEYPSFTPSGRVDATSTVLGQEVQWEDAIEDGVHRRQALVGRSHVFIDATDEAAFTEIAASMSTLRVAE